MKNCPFCQTELGDKAVFCSHCGNRQPETQAADQAVTQAVTQAPPPPVQAPAPGTAQAPVPPYPYPQQVQAPKPPSALALEGKRYFSWLGQGFLGTDEPMHFLFAAIIPFLITLFHTLSTGKMMNWHAGGFFLLWFFNIILMIALPAVAWLCKRYWLKEEIGFQGAFARYSSYQNIVLPISLFVMILGLAISIDSTGGINFLSVFMHLIPILSFAAAALTCLANSKADTRKLWLIMLVLTVAYIILFFLSNLILRAGMTWGWGGFAIF